MPKVRQHIDPLPINRTAKAVLTEVCELVEHGRRNCCDAQNAHFVTRLGGSERTITRALAELERLGMVEISGQGKARRLTPSDKLRAYYTAPTAANRDALQLDSRSKCPPQPRQSGEVGEQTNLDKSGAEPRQKWSANLDKSGSQPGQKWFFTPYSSKEHNEQRTNINNHALAARERAQLETLERENAQLRQLLAERPPAAPLVDVQPNYPTPTSAPHSIAGLTDFEQFWNSYGKKVEVKKCRQIWQKLTPKERQDVLAHVPSYVRAWPDPQFRKNPRSYLNGECWQDELPTAHTKLTPVVQVGNSYDKNKAHANNQQISY